MTPNTSTPDASRRKRILVWGTAIALAVVVVGAGITFALINQPAQTPPAAAEPTPSETPSPTPTATAEPTPTVQPLALPTDCRKIYTQAFLDAWAGEELNSPQLEGVGISRHPAIEDIRVTLPGIDCLWGGATEGGTSNAVNSTTPEQKAALIAAATGEGFTCVDNDTDSLTVCSISVQLSPEEDPDQWTVSEELYFRDGLVVTSWRASTAGTMADTTQPVYDTLWP